MKTNKQTTTKNKQRTIALPFYKSHGFYHKRYGTETTTKQITPPKTKQNKKHPTPLQKKANKIKKKTSPIKTTF